jgi:hypothetical protein
MGDKFEKDQSFQINEAIRQLKAQQEEQESLYVFICMIIFGLGFIFFFFVYVGHISRKKKELENQ